MEDNKTAAGSGIGFGSIIAFILSYCTWHSIGWGIIHTLLGWVYVFYFAIVYTETLKGYLNHLISLF